MALEKLNGTHRARCALLIAPYTSYRLEFRFAVGNNSKGIASIASEVQNEVTKNQKHRMTEHKYEIDQQNNGFRHHIVGSGHWRRRC